MLRLGIKQAGLRAWLGLLALAQLPAQQRMALDDVAPKILAGVLHQHQHLAELAQKGQRLHRLHRQRRDAKHHNARGQAGRAHTRSQLAFEALHKALVHTGARGIGQRFAHIGADGAPQAGLPAVLVFERTGAASVAVLAAQQVMPFSPIAQPVGAVALVAVEHIGHLLRQLVEPAPVALALQIALQRRVDGITLGQRGQEAHQAPEQIGLVKHHLLRHRVCPQHAAIDLPQVATRQLHAGGRANAQSAFIGQRHFQPMLHAVALHQDHLGLQHRQRLCLQELGQQAAQVLQPVAMQDHETGGIGCGIGRGLCHSRAKELPRV